MGSVVSGILGALTGLLGGNKGSNTTTTIAQPSTAIASAPAEAAKPTEDTSATSTSALLKKKAQGKQSLTITPGSVSGGTGTNM